MLLWERDWKHLESSRQTLGYRPNYNASQALRKLLIIPREVIAKSNDQFVVYNLNQVILSIQTIIWKWAYLLIFFVFLGERWEINTCNIIAPCLSLNH